MPKAQSWLHTWLCQSTLEATSPTRAHSTHGQGATNPTQCPALELLAAGMGDRQHTPSAEETDSHCQCAQCHS